MGKEQRILTSVLMEKSGQPHAQEDLSLEKESRCPLNK
jgi:hypothetical protein